MSYRFGASLVPGAHHHGGGGLGLRGDAVPSSGASGPGYLYGGLTLPDDAAKEVRGLITRWPSGTLAVYEDSSFTYSGATDYALYQLYVDGAASTLDIGYGAGVGRLDLNVGDLASGSLSGGVVLADIAPSGVLAAQASALSGAVQLGDAVPAGQFVGDQSALPAAALTASRQARSAARSPTRTLVRSSTRPVQ